LIAVVVVAFLFRNYLPSADQGRPQTSGPSQWDAPRQSSDTDSVAAEPPNGSERDLPGDLRDVGQQVYQSPAGLRYGPGSREGHRLQHVMLHCKDQPDRPGSHGVFAGGIDETIRIIDEAYRVAQQRGPPTRVRRDGGRTIYTVDLDRKIGFVGGQTGKRTGHPPCHHVRLVLEGNRIITAFPVKP
jgi:hypothetical protein